MSWYQKLLFGLFPYLLLMLGGIIYLRDDIWLAVLIFILSCVSWLILIGDYFKRKDDER